MARNKSRSSRNTSGEAPLPATPPPEVSDAPLLEPTMSKRLAPNREQMVSLGSDVEKPVKPTTGSPSDVVRVRVGVVGSLSFGSKTYPPGAELNMPRSEAESVAYAVELLS